MIIDTTERRIMEEKLQESEQRFKSLYDSMIEGVAIHEMVYGDSGEAVDYRIIDVNPAYETILGLKRKQVINKLASEAYGVDDPPYLETYAKVVLTGKPQDFETHYPPLQKNFMISAFSPRENQFATVFEDITNRIQAEQTLREDETRRRILIEQSRDGIVVLNNKGEVFEANQSFARMLGYSIKESLRLKVWDWEYQHPKKVIFKMLRDVDTSGDHFETKWRRKDSSIIDVEITSNAADISGQKLIFCVCRDISERKKHEAELDSLSSELRKLSTHIQTAREEERILIAREIHDELGQSLTALKIDISLLEDSIEKSPDISNQFRELNKYADSIIKMVNRISSDLRPAMLDDFGLLSAIEWQLDEFQKKSGVNAAIKLPDKELNVSQVVATNIYRIVQESLTNIMRHAKASDMEFCMVCKDEKIVVTIADNGRGLEMGKLGNLKSFGLIGMRERAISIGGKLTIECKVGSGTTVKLIVPIGEE